MGWPVAIWVVPRPISRSLSQWPGGMGWQQLLTRVQSSEGVVQGSATNSGQIGLAPEQDRLGVGASMITERSGRNP
jgi:hypothetical protein